MSSKSVGAAFVLAFLLVTVITLVFPSLPPAQTLYEFLNFPQSSATVFGIPFTNFLIAITNGFLWILVGAALYGFASFASREDPLPPLPEAPYWHKPPPEPLLVNQFSNRIPPSISVKIPRLDYEIEAIEGIGSIRGKLLRNLGIKTVDDLLNASATKHDRCRLARKVGVTEETLLDWINRGDLLRVRGVGKQYSELLESVGVDSVTDLSSRNPILLHKTLKTVNRQKRLVKRVPPISTVEGWVNYAKTLEF